jgi:hypothetical protein
VTEVLWAGTLVGALLGLCHAVYVFRVIEAEAPAESAPSYTRPAYYALWTFGLWVLFGSYVLVLWLTGLVFYTVFKAFR